MRAAVVLLVLVALSATQVSEAKPGWFRRTVRNVGGWIRDHVRVRLYVSRSVRSVDKVLKSLDCPMQDILKKYDCAAEGVSPTLDKEMEAAIFEESDSNQDKHLSADEQKTFELLFLREILTVCLKERATAGNLM